jgi:hypothetical protein
MGYDGRNPAVGGGCGGVGSRPASSTTPLRVQRPRRAAQPSYEAHAVTGRGTSAVVGRREAAERHHEGNKTVLQRSPARNARGPSKGAERWIETWTAEGGNPA